MTSFQIFWKGKSFGQGRRQARVNLYKGEDRLGSIFTRAKAGQGQAAQPTNLGTYFLCQAKVLYVDCTQ